MRYLAAFYVVILLVVSDTARADGCAKERALSASEKQFLKERSAAAEKSFPAPPAGWVRYRPEPGLPSRVTGGFVQESICEDYEPRPLRWTVHATYTPKDSALMRDLAWQREDAQSKRKQEELQAQMTAAGQRGDFEAMNRYAQEMQTASAPIGAKAATPLSDAELERRTEELDRRMEQAQQKNDLAAIQRISAEQMALLMRQSGVDTSGVAAVTPSAEDVNAAPRVHVVVEFNLESFEAPRDARRISHGGSALGWLERTTGHCFADGGPADKAYAVVLLDGWAPAGGAVYRAARAQQGGYASVASTMVTVCGDPATVEKLLPAIQYSALR